MPGFLLARALVLAILDNVRVFGLSFDLVPAYVVHSAILEIQSFMVPTVLSRALE